MKSEVGKNNLDRFVNYWARWKEVDEGIIYEINSNN